MLAEFITVHRKELIGRCKAKATKRAPAPPPEEALEHGVPKFLDELVEELHLENATNPAISKTAALYGHDLLRQGLSVSQVVHTYGDVCQSITELAVELDAPIETDDFRRLNRCLDDAIAAAVTQYGAERDGSMDGDAADASARLEELTRDLRKSIHTANVTLDIIKGGSVGVAGSTGKVLDRNLTRALELIERLSAEVAEGRRSAENAAVRG